MNLDLAELGNEASRPQAPERSCAIPKGLEWFERPTGKVYRIMGTVSTGWRSHECVDHIFSLESGETRPMERLTTLSFIEGAKPISKINKEKESIGKCIKSKKKATNEESEGSDLFAEASKAKEL